MKNTLCWQCNKPYPMKEPECPHCHAANANYSLPQAEAELEMREETVYEKSARWAWPDGRPDL